MADRLKHEITHGAYLAAHDPEAQWNWSTPAGQRRASRRGRLISAAAGLGPGRRVLEVGCGSGLFTAMFAATGAAVTAIDVSPELLAYARTRCPAVHFIAGAFEDARDLGEAFDAVVGSSVLHHLDVPRALERARALLRPGGAFAFAEPNYLNPQVAFTLAARRYFPEVSPDETAFVRWRLASALRRAGFVDVSIAPFDWLHPATPRALMAAVSRLGGAAERVPLLREWAGSLLIAARG